MPNPFAAPAPFPAPDPRGAASRAAQPEWGGLLDYLAGHAGGVLRVLVAVAAVVLILFAVRRVLDRNELEHPGRSFRNQLVMIGLTIAGLVGVVLSLPSGADKEQLLNLLGILLSAAIALSSTTLLGNAMAGVMLRALRNFKPGDFVRVGEHFGRVSERGLVHTEIQTEDRDLTTLPNLYLVTTPVTVVRASGTVLSATVSIGYEVPRRRVEEALLEAARRTGLEEPFVHVSDLGDFSVVWRVAGILTDVVQLVSVRSSLRKRMLDALHEANIEIVSPTFMYTRPLSADQRVLPPPGPSSEPLAETSKPEDRIFDKAESAAGVERRRARYTAVGAELEELERELRGAVGAAREALERRKDTLERERGALAHAIELAAAEASAERDEH